MNKAEVLLLLKSNPEDLLSRVGIIVEQEMGDSLASLWCVISHNCKNICK